ncbi:hypothetical protein RB7186 [Rhodopirellula baltica SH 1]|uniref:Uncharacterized protein n=1 Tax=Rhodopirellula baltica (strain DSM 10527 / NCIMB 13988 / SH1) TaxID=243090 RepID=Q7UP38_RHOBA|nr:hypothetical protein RB7186 [Rhodopirellula baltica SH 1]
MKGVFRWPGALGVIRRPISIIRCDLSGPVAFTAPLAVEPAIHSERRVCDGGPHSAGLGNCVAAPRFHRNA